jgi:ATP-binding cassette subfamily B protein
MWRTLSQADRLLIRVCVRTPGWGLVLVTGMCTATAASLLTPASLTVVANAVVAHTDTGPATVRLAAVLLGGALGSLAAALAAPVILARSSAWLGHRLFRHMICLGMRGQQQFPAGDMTSRLLDGTQATAGVTLNALEVVMSLVTSLAAVTALWLVNWLLGAVFLLAAGPVIVVTQSSMRGMPGLYLRYQQAQGRIAARLTEALNGIRTIQSSGTIDREVERILRPLPELAAAGRETWAAQRRVTWRCGLCFALMELAVLTTAGWQIAIGRLSPGAWLAAAGYTTLALGVFTSIDAVMEIAHSRAGAVRVSEVLETRPVGPPGGTASLGAGRGCLTLRQVTVRSGGHLVLNGLNLHIPAGLTVAVVGRSGTGKSTLVATLGRLTEPDEGEILLDGIPVTSLAPAGLRRAVAYAFARPASLGTTIADDIGYGALPVARADIERAARMAGAGDFIRRLPGGYDTPLDQAPLSGGERQRLGIARALVRRARVLVLDDATSSLDTATEARINSALQELRAAQTTIIVAHRAATAARADAVVWLDDGRVRSMAPHEQLWRDPAYRAIFCGDASPASVPLTEVGS